MRDWAYLDEMDKNTLYSYANFLSGNYKNNRLREDRKTVYYIFWVVFRYALGIQSYDEARKVLSEELLLRYKLYSILDLYYVGIDISDDFCIKFPKISATQHNVSDAFILILADVVLKTIYERSELLDEVEAFTTLVKQKADALPPSKYKLRDNLNGYYEKGLCIKKHIGNNIEKWTTRKESYCG